MTTPGMQGGAAAAATAVGTPVPAPGKTAVTTEEQAKAIICAAQRAVEEAKSGGGGGFGALSLKKSLEWFLEARRRNSLASAAGAGGIQPHIDDFCSSSN